ncbi:MAG: hypothetical protein ABR599_06945 [Gemmatimonadota bacterium]
MARPLAGAYNRCMSKVDQLREVVRAQKLGDLRRAEFQAIVEALAPEERVRALAPAELRGRPGYVVATGRRVFFAHAGLAGTAITPVAPTLAAPRLVAEDGGSLSLVFRSSDGSEVVLEAIPPEHAQAFRARLPGSEENGLDPGE